MAQTQQAELEQPQEVANASAPAHHEKPARAAKDIHPTKPIGHEAVRVAKRETPHIERVANTHVRHAPSEAHRRA